MPAAISASRATTPITMPAMAPPESLDECATGEFAGGVGEEIDDEVCDVVETEEPVVVALDAADMVDVELECVSVAAINNEGVKSRAVAEGEAETREEYVSLSWVMVMLSKSVDGTVFQQMLI
jgi:hypothetical protein